MWSFGRKRKQKEALKEAQIQGIHSEVIERIDKAAKTIDEYSLDKLIKNPNNGVTELIFLATGGDRRLQGKKK